jgi:3-hydroxybutyrate dehydrogenase
VHSFEASKEKSAYVASKHAQLGMVRAIALEGAKYNIAANLIAPGFVKTPLVEKQIPEQAKALNISEEEVVKKVMLGKTIDGEFTSLEDIARASLFCATFPTLGFSGQSMIISHGWHMQ